MASREGVEREGTDPSDRRASGGGGAFGCAKEASVVAASAMVSLHGLGASNSSCINAASAPPVDEQCNLGGSVCGGGDQQSTGANQRVTSAGADQLATPASGIQGQELRSGHCNSGEYYECSSSSGSGTGSGNSSVSGCGSGSGIGRRSGNRVGRAPAASTVRVDGSLKIRSKHFSASVNQFNYEPSGEEQEGTSARDISNEQEQQEQERDRQADHGYERGERRRRRQQQQQQQQQSQQQPNCSLIRQQPEQEQDVATEAAKLMTSSDGGGLRKTTHLFVSATTNERRDQGLESAAASVTAIRTTGAQAQVAPGAGLVHSSASRQQANEKQPQQQQIQIKHDSADQFHERRTQTCGSNLDGPVAHLEDTGQNRQESLVSANSPSFWARLSNLSRSIIQQQQQRQSYFSQPALTSSVIYAPEEVKLDNNNHSFLAPEVLSYLETKKKQSNFTASSTTATASGVVSGHHDLSGEPQVASERASTMTKTSSCKRADGHEQQELHDGCVTTTTTTTTTSRLDDATVSRCRIQETRKQEEQQQQATRRRKRETVTQITRQHLDEQQQQQQQPPQLKHETCPPLHRSQINVGGHKVIKPVELQQATISSSTSSSSKIQQQQQQKQLALKTTHIAANELELAERLEDRTTDTNIHTHASGKQPAGEITGRHHQVKLSIATNATNTTTTNTTTTSTATGRSSSASSLSSCILSESMSGQSDEVRLKWGKKMDFLLSIIGFAVDLANIWRFPYLVYKNGGGVFLIPYLTMLIFGGIPLFFLELCLGQFVKKGPITVWNKICPYMKGVGYCSILISWYVSFYYNVLIAWSVYFIYRSITSFGHKMPWEDCDNSWNTVSTCVSITQLKELCSHKTNVTLESCRKEMFSAINVTSPASEFFVKELSQIDQSSGLDDMGYLRPELVCCTLVVYLLHYFSLFRGLETSGKVVWVTATAPYMILSILFVRGLFLPGASMGIEYYLSPKLERLADPQVWIDAAGQVFYSIGVGFGVHLTYASFNSHDNNCYRDCLMTSAVNALTSVYSGLVVFVYLGYMATNLGIEIDKVASEGYSLVFEVYPEALTTLPFARFWSILFFIMLLTLGIDSAMGGLEAVITGLEDEFKFAKRLTRGQLTGLVIVSSFLPALVSCTQGGAYTLFWFDIYSAGVSLLFSALFETIGVVYCYGLDKFILNIESMLGKRPQFFYIICWKYISPTFLMGIIFMSIYTVSVPTYRGYTFPMWSVVLGWCLTFSSVAAVPIVAIWTLYSRSGNKAVSISPSKSPRKAVAGGSKNVSRKSTPSLGDHQCRKAMSTINYSDAIQQGGARATSSVINLPPDQHHQHHHHHHHCYKQGTRIEEEML